MSRPRAGFSFLIDDLRCLTSVCARVARVTGPRVTRPARFPLLAFLRSRPLRSHPPVLDRCRLSVGDRTRDFFSSALRAFLPPPPSPPRPAACPRARAASATDNGDKTHEWVAVALAHREVDTAEAVQAVHHQPLLPGRVAAHRQDVVRIPRGARHAGAHENDQRGAGLHTVFRVPLFVMRAALVA